MIPDWPEGTVAVLATAGADGPHAIPVSTAVRIGPRTVMLALALRRESLARLRRDPRCALTIMAGDVALTAHGRATIVEEPMVVSDRVAAVRIDVEAIQDHDDDRFEIDAGVRWHWTDRETERLDVEIRTALSRLAQ